MSGSKSASRLNQRQRTAGGMQQEQGHRITAARARGAPNLSIAAGLVQPTRKRPRNSTRPPRRRTGALNRGQAEQLIILLEEAAEVIQVSAKILRFGLRSYNPLDPTRTPNHVLLESEIGDFEGVVENLKQAGFAITTRGIRSARNAKRRRLKHWLLAGSPC